MMRGQRGVGSESEEEHRASLHWLRQAREEEEGSWCSWIYLCPFAAVGAQRLDMGAPGRGAYPGWQFGGLSTSTGVGLF